MFRLNLALALSLGGASLLFAAAPAEAHYMLAAPSNWWTQLTDGSPQKTPPCGNEVIAGTVRHRNRERLSRRGNR